MQAIALAVVAIVAAILELLAWRAVRKAAAEAEGWRQAYFDAVEKGGRNSDSR